MDEARPNDRERSIEPHGPDLHVQIEQVSVALQHLRQTQDSLSSLESRLAEMTRDCAAILDGWAKNDEKHATAVVELHSRLSEWNEIERRLLNESTTRIHQFERGLQHEWTAIRQAHEEPIRQLDAQTTRISEACLTAVDQALRRFDAAEARLASLEEGLHREIDTLTREVRDAVSELRQGAPQLSARQPWSIDNVVRLHNELRGEGEGAPAPALVGVGSTLGLATQGARGSLALAGVMPAAADHSPAPPRVGASDPATPSAVPTPLWRRAPVVAAAIVALVLGGFAVYLESQVQAGLREAATRAEAAERGASEARAEARQELNALQKVADQRLETAQQAARSAQTLAAIAAASDLRRFDLTSRDKTVSAQALFSVSQGIAFSASSLPVPPNGKTYQLWLIGPDRATGVGVVPGGRTNLTFPTPAPLPRPVVRASLTLEPTGGSPLPTSSAFLLSPVPVPRPPAAP